MAVRGRGRRDRGGLPAGLVGVLIGSAGDDSNGDTVRTPPAPNPPVVVEGASVGDVLAGAAPSSMPSGRPWSRSAPTSCRPPLGRHRRHRVGGRRDPHQRPCGPRGDRDPGAPAGDTEPIPAEVVATDAGNDLALLQIDADDLTPVTFAPTADVELGDEVLAIGFALDLDGDPSVTLGIVSALDRTIITRRRPRRPDPDRRRDLLGQLRRTAGQRRRPVVGINTAVARSDVSTAATNVGFAIGMDEVEPVLVELRAAGRR